MLGPTVRDGICARGPAADPTLHRVEPVSVYHPPRMGLEWVTDQVRRILGQVPAAVYVGDGRVLAKTAAGPMLLSAFDRSLMPPLVLYGMYERGLVTWLRKSLRAGDVFVDVGANVGWFTLVAARSVGPTGRVVAIEADPRTYALLLENITMNYVGARVETHNVAVWDEETTLTLHQSERFFGNSTVVPFGKWYHEEYSDSFTEVTVPAIRLESILKGEVVRAMKLDIEGAEGAALAGLGSELRSIETLLLEINPRAAGSAWPGLRDWLEQVSTEFTFEDLRGRRLSAADVVSGMFYPTVVIHRRGSARGRRGR